jgi:hypothetical protein
MIPISSKDIGKQRKWVFLLLGLLTALIICIALMAAVPPVSRDALTHHLAIPKLYLKHGGIHEIPALKYSYYPMNLDLLYLAALYFKNDILPKYIHFAFALFTGLLLYRYLNQRINRHYALFGVLSFLSIPVIVKLSITVYVDLGLIFFSTAALLFLFKWLDSECDLKHLLIAAFFCGLALGTKYNGLLVLLLLALFTPYAYMRRHSADKAAGVKALAYSGVFVLTALIVFSPWMIRNYMWTNNPLFPLYDSFFNPAAPYPAIPLKPFVERHLIYHESWMQIALVPIRIFFQGQDNHPQYFDGQLNPFLLLLPLFAFCREANDRPNQMLERQLLAAFAILYILYAFFTKDMRVRYIAPAVPVLVLLAMYGLRNLFSLAAKTRQASVRWSVRALISGALIGMLLLNGHYIYEQFQHVRPWRYIMGQVDRDAYIQEYRPEYATFQYINKRLADDARLLAVFLGRRSYYCDREMVFGIESLKDMVQTAASAKEIRDAMARSGFTHVVVGRRLYEKWQRDTFNAEERSRLNDFWQAYTVLIHRQAGYELYRLENNAA